MTTYALELRSVPTPPRGLRAESREDSGPRADLDLARRLAKGDAVAAESIYRATLIPVYAYVHARLGDRDETEDVVQDVYLTAMKVARTFDGRSTLLTWLTGIARNKARERVRARIRARGRSADAIEAARALLSLEESAPPDALLRAAETASLVAEVLALLPPRFRRALRLKYVDGASLADVGRAEGVSPKAAESLVVRARRAFMRVAKTLARRRLGEDLP